MLSDSYIISHKYVSGEKMTLDEPLSKDRVLNCISELMDNREIQIISIKCVTKKELDRRTIEWLNEKFEEDTDVYYDAIFDTKNEAVWPFDLLNEDALDDPNIAKWVWNNCSREQKDHIRKWQELS